MSLGSETAAADPAGPGAASARGRRRVILAAAVCAAVAVLLFLAYLGQSRSLGTDADGASNVLQAWDMLHGNPLLRGWWLSDVSFYTTELPEYALIELARGLSPAVINVAGALTYTLLLAGVALLARGRATGRAGLARMAVAAGIMLAPGPGFGASSLLSTPDHIGTQVPLVLTWLALDWLDSRWYLPWMAGILLTWVEIADTMAVYVGAVPVMVVSAIRLWQRRPSWRIDAGLLAAAVVSVAAAAAALSLIHRAGGFSVARTSAVFITSAQLPHNVSLTAGSVLTLFGADFFGLRLGIVAVVALIHLTGLALAVWACCIAGRRLLSSADRVVPILFAGLAVNLAAFALSTQAVGLGSTHELAAVLPFSAALAGRLLPGRPQLRALCPLLLAVLACYAGALAYHATQPPAPAPTAPVASWLASRHLTAGLGDYWTADITTVAAHGRVRVSPVVSSCGRFIPDTWESEKPWYQAPATATFLVLVRVHASSRDGTGAQAVAEFGAPQRTAPVGAYEVLVWGHDLLPALTRPPAPGCG